MSVAIRGKDGPGRSCGGNKLPWRNAKRGVPLLWAGRRGASARCGPAKQCPAAGEWTYGGLHAARRPTFPQLKGQHKMKRYLILLVAMAAALSVSQVGWADDGCATCNGGSTQAAGRVLGQGSRPQMTEYTAPQPDYPWHGPYYNASWGMPVALVVPPTATRQSHYGWGVGGTRTTVVRHQFSRNYPGPGMFNRQLLRPTPIWPTDTDQFGIYYVRGPW